MTKSTLKLGSLATAVLLLLAASSAAAEGELKVDIVSVDDSDAPGVTAVVNVLDPTGQPVSNLAPDNFQVSVNGEPASPADVRTAVNSDIGVAVVLTVDVSGSMEGAPIQQARTAAKTFVEGLAPIDSAAVLAFSDNVRPVQDFTTEAPRLLTAVDSLQAIGNTALYQATSVSAFVAASVENQRRAIILLSDGLDYGGASAVSRDASIAQARQVGVPFFAVGLGSEIDRQYLTELAEATGGQFLETPSPEGLNSLFRSIGEFLRSQYVVTVQVEGLDRSQPLDFELEVRSGELSGRASLSLDPRDSPAASPTVILSGIWEGAEIEGPVTILAQLSDGVDLESVTFLVGGDEAGTVTEAPFQITLDPGDYVEGEHVLLVQTRDVLRRTTTTEVPFTSVVPGVGGGGGAISPWLIALGLVVLAAVAGGAFVLMQARRRGEVPAESLEPRVKPWSTVQDASRVIYDFRDVKAPELEDRVLGRLVLTNGPQAGEGFEVGQRPRRIGAASYCDIVLGDDEGRVSPEEARVWVSEGRLMYHRIFRLTSTPVEDSSSATWLILEPGDQLSIGPHRLMFELADGEAPQPEPSQESDEAPTPFPTPEPAAPRPTTVEAGGSREPRADEPTDP